jgi:RNA polymerase sigma factor (sigma-70 family)
MRNVILTDISALEQNKGVTQVIQTYGRRLKDFIRQRVATPEDAEDVLQDVYIDLTETMRVETVEQVAAWLYRVARNKIIDRYRKHKPLLINDLNAGSNEDEDDYSFLEDLLGAEHDSGFLNKDNEFIRESLMAALDELPAEQREVFIRHEIEQQSFKEISDDLGVTVNTLLSRKHYAIKFLRKRLADLYIELFGETTSKK